MKKVLSLIIILLICGFMIGYVFSMISEIGCEEDNCGTGCPDGHCSQADWCQSCIIHNCWDSQEMEYFDLECGRTP